MPRPHSSGTIRGRLASARPEERNVTTPHATLLAVTVSLAATSAVAAPPAVMPSAGVALKAGDTVSIDLSALPWRLEGEAKVTCVGVRFVGTGPTESRCVRVVRFDLPADGVRMTLLFKGAGGREQSIDLPVTRSTTPVTFVAPSAGSLLSPKPTVIPPEEVERAAKANAEAQCANCGGQGFKLESVEVTRQPLPPGTSLPFRFSVTSTAPGK